LHVAIVSVATTVSVATIVSAVDTTLSLVSVYASLFLSRVLPSPSVSRISLFLVEFKMDFFPSGGRICSDTAGFSVVMRDLGAKVKAELQSWC
jgi:hypothetical protein